MELKKIRSKRYICADILTMALRIQKYNQDKITFIGILKGGMFTTYSLLKLFSSEKKDMRVGHLGLSSYKDGAVSAGRIKITYPLDLDESCIEGRDIWIIDDVVDSGLTLEVAKNIVSGYNPSTIHTAVLVDKSLSLVGKPDVVGYSYGELRFLVGCGMGKGEKYRHLESLYELIENEGEE